MREDMLAHIQSICRFQTRPDRMGEPNTGGQGEGASNLPSAYQGGSRDSAPGTLTRGKPEVLRDGRNRSEVAHTAEGPPPGLQCPM